MASPVPSPSPSPSPRVKTALLFLEGFTTLSPTTHLSLRSPSCTQIWAPTSLNPPSPKNNAEFSLHLSRLQEVMSSFPVTAKEIIESENENKVVIWATSEAKFHEELKTGNRAEWDYRGEYVFMLSMDKEGRIERIVEFLDSLATERLRGLMERAREKKRSLNSGSGECDDKVF